MAGEQQKGGDGFDLWSGRPVLLAIQIGAVVVAGTLGLLRLDGGEENRIRSADVSQKGQALVIEVAIRQELAISSLRRFPDTSDPAARYLCAELGRLSGGQTRRICVGGENASRRAVGVSLVSESGFVTKESTVRAKVTRETPFRVSIAILPGKIGVEPGRYGWRAIYADGECADPEAGCGYSLPDERLARYRVRPVDAVGCRGGNGQVVRHGPRKGGKVALTFDDGPSADTPAVLSILKRHKVKATFFVIGSAVRSNPATARRIVAQGHEIANHSYSHPILPSRSQLTSTNRAIRSVTRFRPCLFRPPYGALDSRLARDAGAEKMKTVLWDADTADWQLPGSGAIAAVAGGARSGSIVLMHDGGGPRGQTVAALGPAISALKRRGKKLVTVSKLLGNETIYRPR